MRKLIILIASAAFCAVPAVASAAPANIVGGTEAAHAIALSGRWSTSVVQLPKHSARRADRPIGLTVVWGS